MPKIRPLLREDKLKYRVEHGTLEAEKLLLQYRITKTEIAHLLGVTPAAISYQFRSRRMTYETKCAIDQIIEERQAAARAL